MVLFNLWAKHKVDLIKSAKEYLLKLWEPTQIGTKNADEATKYLSRIKSVLTGTPEGDIEPDQVAQVIQYMKEEDFLLLLTRTIHLLPMQSPNHARKDAQVILSYVFRARRSWETDELTPALSYVVNERPEVITQLCWGLEEKDSATHCSVVLREIIKFESVAAIILYSQSSAPNESAIRLGDINYEEPQTGRGIFWQFFRFIDEGSFELSYDVFSIFRDILLKHKALVAKYLEINFDVFFRTYNKVLIQSKNYVTKRQSIRLLGELLLDRKNYDVMIRYVQSAEHLKMCMILLTDDRKMIKYESFHVFKIFVANPNKSAEVQRILFNNRDRLLGFLPTFLDDRQDDEQFFDEKAYIVRQIEEIQAPPPAQ